MKNGSFTVTSSGKDRPASVINRLKTLQQSTSAKESYVVNLEGIERHCVF